MKIFITGGAGFIGSHLAERLMASGKHSVCVYDNLTSGKKDFIKSHLDKKNFRFIKADLLNFAMLKKSLSGFDMVFHLASNPDIAKSMTQTDLDLKQGIIATFNVLEAMRLNSVKKIAYVSGSGVYGDIGKTYTAENYGPLMPISMYGASKLSAEALISAFSSMFGMQAWIFRLANIIGPRQTHGVIFDFIRKLKENPGELKILGDGLQSKSYLHVGDCLDAIQFCVSKAHDAVNIFNVATSDYITVRKIAKIVIAAMKLRNVSLRYSGGTRGWKGDVPVVRIDAAKINKLGWSPKLSSHDAVIRSTQENLCRW